MTLLLLSTDILLSILSYSGPLELARLGRTCKLFGSRTHNIEEVDPELGEASPNCRHDEMMITGGPGTKMSLVDVASCKVLRPMWSKPIYKTVRKDILHFGAKLHCFIWYQAKSWTSAYLKFLQMSRDTTYMNDVGSVKKALDILYFECVYQIKSLDDVETRFKLLALQFHPDKHPLYGRKNKMTLKETTIHFQRIVKARNYLKKCLHL